MKKIKKEIKFSEQDLQRAVLQRLAYCHNVYYFRNNSVSGKFIRSNGTTGWVNNAKKGSPDIVLCKNGLWIGLELKAEDGRQSKEQQQAEKDIRNAGGHYFIIKSLNDLEAILENF
jgi:outer membrane protein assembly factor BamB